MLTDKDHLKNLSKNWKNKWDTTILIDLKSICCLGRVILIREGSILNWGETLLITKIDLELEAKRTLEILVSLVTLSVKVLADI